MALMDLKQVRCKTCGEPLDLNGARDGVIKCAVCDCCFTLPKTDANQKVLDYLFQAEGDLDTGRFEEAYTKYAKASELDRTEPEAYWGMALAENGIQYLKDEVNNRLQPVCHEINGEVFSDGSNFLKALRYATDAQRDEYERKGEEIDRIKREFFNLKKRGVDYDCFICVKVTDESGGKTADGDFAHQLYRMLKNNSFSPFYSEAVLRNVTGADYEAHILYALTTAETMLVVCFDEAYLRTKWVKNEYTRFLKLVNDEEKESDSITIVYRGKPIEKLPSKKGKIQGIDANELDFSHRILQFVESHTPEAKRQREELAVSSSAAADDLRKKLAEQEERFRQLEAMLKAQQAQAAQPQPQRTVQPVTPAHKPQSSPQLQTINRNDDEIFVKALKFCITTKQATTTDIQRNFSISFLKACKIMDWMETMNYVSPSEGTKPRRVLLSFDEFNRIYGNALEKPAPATPAVPKPAPAVSVNSPRANPASEFEISGGVLKKYKGGSRTVVIPARVTEIGNYAFNNCGIESVEIHGEVEKIGNYAFNNCSALEEVTLADGLWEIDNYAFNNCSSLESVTVPATVSEIGSYAFNNCSSLEEVYIGSEVRRIGSHAFNNCSSLRRVTLPSRFKDSLTKIFGYYDENCLFVFTD